MTRSVITTGLPAQRTATTIGGFVRGIDRLPDDGLLTGWTQDQQRRGLQPSTIHRRRLEVRNLALWLEARQLGLLDATTELIETWADDRHVGNRTRYAYLSHVSAFYKWAVYAGYLLQSPAEAVRRPKRPRSIPRPMVDADLAIAILHADSRLRAMICLAALAGLRCMEIAWLRREDLLDHNDPPVLIVTHAKGDRERTIPLHPALWDALRHHGLPRSGWVFPNCRSRGDPLIPHRVSDLINGHLRDCGVTATAHSLRHWFASQLYQASMDLRLVQEALGHASPTTTAGYAAFAPRRAGEVIAALQLPLTHGRWEP